MLFKICILPKIQKQSITIKKNSQEKINSYPLSSTKRLKTNDGAKRKQKWTMQLNFAVCIPNASIRASFNELCYSFFKSHKKLPLVC